MRFLRTLYMLVAMDHIRPPSNNTGDFVRSVMCLSHQIITTPEVDVRVGNYRVHGTNSLRIADQQGNTVAKGIARAGAAQEWIADTLKTLDTAVLHTANPGGPAEYRLVRTYGEYYHHPSYQFSLAVTAPTGSAPSVVPMATINICMTGLGRKIAGIDHALGVLSDPAVQKSVIRLVGHDGQGLTIRPGDPGMAVLQMVASRNVECTLTVPRSLAHALMADIHRMCSMSHDNVDG
jgi:hypothetical protein